MRYCRFCNTWKPKNNDNFAKNGEFYRTKCRLCRNKTNERKTQIEYKIINNIKYQKCTCCGEWLESNSDNFQLINEKGIKEDGNLQTRGWCKKCVYGNSYENWKIKQERENNLPNTLTNKQWRETLKYFNYTCAYCGKTEKQNKDETKTIKRPNGFKLGHDHIIPVIKQGSYSKENIVPCCSKCNSKKGTFDFYEWYINSDVYNEDKYNKIINFINTYNNN